MHGEAHENLEGLRRLLEDVRAMMPEGRVITVFGCGGDRDRAKRPEMGLVASTFSDLTIVTSDNPRSESPESIIDAIMSGVASGAHVERDADRRGAISRALDEAAPIVAKINQELAAATADPTVRDRFLQQGAEPMALSLEEAARFISSETVKWRDIITKAGIPQIQ